MVFLDRPGPCSKVTNTIRPQMRIDTVKHYNLIHPLTLSSIPTIELHLYDIRNYMYPHQRDSSTGMLLATG
jgi:hypothetical protein